MHDSGPGPWRCFQCGTLCETEHEAREHFGDFQKARLPRCFAFGEEWISVLETARLARFDLDHGRIDVARQRLTEIVDRLMTPYGPWEGTRAQTLPWCRL